MLDHLPEGAWLRVESRIRVREGTAVPAGADSLVVIGDAGRAAFTLDEIDRLWLEGRATRSVSTGGLVAGSVTGALFGVLVDGLCSSLSGDGCAGAIPIFTVLFGGGGWLVGRVVGSAVPTWTLLYEREGAEAPGAPDGARAAGESPDADAGAGRDTGAGEAHTRVPPVRVFGPRIGSIEVHAGYGTSSDAHAPGGGSSFRAAFVAWWRQRLALGPELQYTNLGGGEHVAVIGGVMRLGLGSRTPRRVDVVLGLGAYHFEYDLSRYTALPAKSGIAPVGREQTRYFGGSLGAALRMPIGGRLYSGIEVRHHLLLQNLIDPRDFGLWTVTAGLERAW